MPLSRLRLRLAGSLALAFAIALVALALATVGVLRRENTRRVDDRLARAVRDASDAIRREVAETPDSSWRSVLQEVRTEWPRGADAWVVTDERGAVLGASDEAVPASVAAASASAGRAAGTLRGADGRRLRLLGGAMSASGVAGDARRFRVVAYAPFDVVEHDAAVLVRRFAVAVPLILLVSVVLGYVFAGRALAPVQALGEAASRIAPDDLTQRLPLPSGPPDELGALGGEFNRLLDRLEAAHQRNLAFVREAAHQIRTPLTLVVGEAEHALSGDPSSSERQRAALQRIRLAAAQMQRRVDELFLLAEAEAGAAVERRDDVELDGLVLECTDLMRARASALGRTLALGTMAPATVIGDAALLREAVLELLENACRHGASTAPVTASVLEAPAGATVEVRNAARDGDADPGTGLGVRIVSWIAAGHGATLRRLRDGDTVVTSIVFPRDTA